MASFTLLTAGAGITVTAAARVGFVGATGVRLTGVIRTGVLVVTQHGSTLAAHTTLALFARRAGVSIIAGGLIGRMGTPVSRITLVVSAFVSVIARDHARADARTILTHVGGRTAVGVVTRRLVGRMEAALLGTTAVVCARVPVFAGHGALSHTGAFDTFVDRRAWVSVRALCLVIGVHTSAVGIATVIRAGIPVVAVGGASTLAGATFAAVSGCARVAVLAQG